MTVPMPILQRSVGDSPLSIEKSKITDLSNGPFWL